jgi:nuclear transport factor 2 (NTF2) superfamily protein
LCPTQRGIADVTSATAALHPRDRRAEGAHGGRCLEFARAGSGCRRLYRKWEKELDYRLIKDLWAFDGNRIAVRFQYEWHDASGNWFRSYGNEQWEFDAHGLMRRREASINDIAISEKDRRFHWPAPGPRPADVPGLGDSPF